RLGRALLDTAGDGAEAVALLSEEVPREYGDDLAGALRRARRGGDAYAGRWAAEVRRLRAVSSASVPPAGGGEPRTGPGGAVAASAGDAEGAATAGAGEAATAGRRQAPSAGPGNAKAAGPRDTATAGAREAAARLRQAPKDGPGESATAGAGKAATARPRQAPPPGPGNAETAGPRDTATAEVGEAAAAGLREAAAAVSGEAEAAVSGEAAAAAAGEDRLVGVTVALAFPERVARLDGGSYLMVSGTRAELGEGSALRGAPWIVVAVADRAAGKGHARVRLGAAVTEDVARAAAGALLEERDEVRWAGGDVVARQVESLGAVELAVRPLRQADPGLVRAALLEGLRAEGLGLLRWSPDATALRQRLAFLRTQAGEPWPDVSDEALSARAAEWLEPELGRARRRADLARIDAGQALARLLPWASGDAARLDELAPERITVPSGSRIRIDYRDPEHPVLAVKLQEMFGLRETPAVAGVPLLVHLLSPAGRPAAVTADLASFWREGYRGVRAELRGRYPKHPWPEDPAGAEPTRHTNARLRR
ncbi:ATP-dependent helicase C-terminal domain-containing protein, partial [Streptomyces sp. ATE26]|uniref:ATP-dependent helicase C-terminal domain-containing protein n=1 Tax=Streptomyces sp. ATE26 TaxID=2954237 RepID=UPI002482D3CE